MQLDHDLLDLWLEGLLLPADARPLIEEMQVLRARIAGSEAQLAAARALNRSLAHEVSRLRQELDELTAHAAGLEGIRDAHMRSLLAGAAPYTRSSVRPAPGG